MNIKNLKIGFLEATGSNSPVFLGEMREDMEFLDGKPTGKRLGTKYIVACPFNNFDKVTVKIADKEPALTQEEFDFARSNETLIRVTFEGFSAKMFQDFKTKEIKLTATATAIKIVDEGV